MKDAPIGQCWKNTHQHIPPHPKMKWCVCWKPCDALAKLDNLEGTE